MVLGGIPFGDATFFIGVIMAQVACFIDGFNLYHVLHECHPAHCKWTNYRVLAEHFLLPGDTLKDVFYFTAHAHWDAGKVARHTAFIKAQEHFGVRAILGKFKEKYPRCTLCKRKYTSHEEKESDVNLAIHLVSLAYERQYDKAFIVSGDSDFVSAIRLVQAKFPNIRVGVLVPFNSRKPHIATHLRRAAHFHHNIERKHLLSSRLPNVIALESGDTVRCPLEYIIR